MPETQKPKLGFCLLAGALAGFINGFFGAGGGMVLVPLLLWLVRLEDKAAFSSAVAVILPLCAVSIAVYAVHDSLPLRDALPYLIGGAAGGAWVVSMHVYMTAVGLTAIPGMAIVQASSLLNYIIGMVIAFGVAFVVSLLLKYKTDAE